MPRLGSSLDGRDDSDGRSGSVGRRSGKHRLTGTRGDAHGNHGDDDDYDNDGSNSSRGDEERDRLLLHSRRTDLPDARRVHTAYAEARCGSASSRWVAIVLLCLLGLILRNALVNDYRGEMIDKLRKGGAAQEEIDRLFPKSFEEKKQTVLDDHKLLESLHGAVAALRVEVDEIKERLAAAELSSAATASAGKKGQEDPHQQTQPPPSS